MVRHSKGMDASTTFEPPDGGVAISFVRGLDRFATFPKFAQQAGLRSRFAVVQETYVEGCVDMHFEEPLWRVLAEFVQSKVPEGVVEVTTEQGESLPMDWFLSEWRRTAAGEREPPPLLTAWSDFRPTVCMVTDYWTRAGGPQPYHDSYTYSLYSNRDLGDEVMSSLTRTPSRSRWALAAEALAAT